MDIFFILSGLLSLTLVYYLYSEAPSTVSVDILMEGGIQGGGKNTWISTSNLLSASGFVYVMYHANEWEC